MIPAVTGQTQNYMLLLTRRLIAPSRTQNLNAQQVKKGRTGLYVPQIFVGGDGVRKDVYSHIVSRGLSLLLYQPIRCRRGGNLK